MMSSKDLKKNEKGKEVLKFEENPTTSLHKVKKEVSKILEANKVTYRESLDLDLKPCKKEIATKNNGAQEINGSSSKIIPYIFYTSDDKARLRWSSDLHDCFVNAVTKLGGPQKATPKRVKDLMEVEGIALHHVKSHLQKFRLGKCHIREGTIQFNKRFRSFGGIGKTNAPSMLPSPQVNIKPKNKGDVKQKKGKEVQGSLYRILENDLQLRRRREAQRMEMYNQHMLNAQSLEANMVLSITGQHSNYVSEVTNTIPQVITSVGDCCCDTMACLSLSDFPQYTSNTHSMFESQHAYTSPIVQFQHNQIYKMSQGFLNPSVFTEPQSMPSSSILVTQQKIHLNCDFNEVFRYMVAPFASSSLHQGTSNVIPFLTTPKTIQAHVPHHTYGSYPPYNSIGVVKAQLSAPQNSRTSQIQEIPSRETNLSSSVTNDEVDPVDKYIDWDKVEEKDFDLD